MGGKRAFAGESLTSLRSLLCVGVAGGWVSLSAPPQRSCNQRVELSSSDGAKREHSGSTVVAQVLSAAGGGLEVERLICFVE